MSSVVILLALITALCYGASDFLGGVAGRRSDPYLVALVGQCVAFVVVGIAVVVLTSHRPSDAALGWGALAGLGNAVGVMALYRGFAAGQMSVVAPLSGVLTAGIPAAVGLILGEHLGPLTSAGIALAIPAVLLVSLSPGGAGGARSAGVVEGILAGLGFAFLLIALDRAGSRFGAWPLLPDSGVGALLTGVTVLASHRDGPLTTGLRLAGPAAGLAGVLGGISTVTYLFASGMGQLSVVAVLTALYPASTVVLARFVLHERWSKIQAVGLVVAALAVGMISSG